MKSERITYWARGPAQQAGIHRKQTEARGAPPSATCMQAVGTRVQRLEGSLSLHTHPLPLCTQEVLSPQLLQDTDRTVNLVSVEHEAGGFGAAGQPGLHSEALNKTTKREQYHPAAGVNLTRLNNDDRDGRS